MGGPQQGEGEGRERERERERRLFLPFSGFSLEKARRQQYETRDVLGTQRAFKCPLPFLCFFMKVSLPFSLFLCFLSLSLTLSFFLSFLVCVFRPRSYLGSVGRAALMCDSSDAENNNNNNYT